MIRRRSLPNGPFLLSGLLISPISISHLPLLPISILGRLLLKPFWVVIAASLLVLLLLPIRLRTVLAFLMSGLELIIHHLERCQKCDGCPLHREVGPPSVVSLRMLPVPGIRSECGLFSFGGVFTWLAFRHVFGCSYAFFAWVGLFFCLLAAWH